MSEPTRRGGQHRRLASLAVALLVAGCAGPEQEATPPAHPADMVMSQEAAPAGHEIPAGDPIPTISLRRDGETDDAWAFSITTDMALTMDTAPYEPMRGHVHVYVDGVEKQMIAVKQFTLTSVDLPPGTHQISVALADTTHRDLLSGGLKIQDSLEIDVPTRD